MLPYSIRRIALFLGVVGGIAVGLGGCATPPPADDPDAVAEFKETNDPLEPTNRVMFDVSMTLDDIILHPVALGYRETVPQFGRNRVSDVLANVKSPLIFANDMLQGDFKRAGRTLARFVLNTTFGVGGVMDVATPMGIPGHESDLGETLGVWGVPEGPYLFIPLLGPSNVRDMTGSVAQSFADPLQIYLDDNGMWWVALTWAGVGAVATREAYLDSLDELKRNSLDFYSALRSASRQRRQAQIAEEISGNDTPSAAVIRIFPRFQWNF